MSPAKTDASFERFDQLPADHARPQDFRTSVYQQCVDAPGPGTFCRYPLRPRLESCSRRKVSSSPLHRVSSTSIEHVHSG